MNYSFHPLGDHAVIIEFGKEIRADIQKIIQIVANKLDDRPFDWMIEYVPAFTTITIFYDIQIVSRFVNDQFLSPYDYVCHQLETILTAITIDVPIESRIVEIPVCYGGEFGPDLSYVASYNGLTEEEVISIHAKNIYLVYMIGFAPGFPYIGGLSKRIATPRKETPRLKIPAGSVGIAGEQTGIYPIETPGGWQLIGRTPLQLFTPDNDPPCLLRAGDRLKFKPISFEEYLELEQGK